MKITAWAALKPKDKLRKYTYQKNLGKNDVLIDIKYCSLLTADVFFINNFWGDSKYPLVPSTEMFGFVSKIGKEVDSLRVGDFVGVGYIVSSCMKCQYCKAGKEQFCSDQRVIDVHEYGGLAKNIIVNSNFVYKIPPRIRRPECVSLMGYGVTAYSAIKNANLTKGAKVAIVGLGNLGHIALQILSKMGYWVIALTHSKEKHSFLRRLGAKGFIDPTNSKELKKHKKEFDFILITTYFSYRWPKLIELLYPEGNLCFLGLPEKDIAFPSVLLADYARRKVTGSYFGSRKDMKELLIFAAKNNIRAKTTVYPISKANEVLGLIENGKIPFNAVIRVD